MEDVSRLTQPGRGVCVDGEDVEIKRVCRFMVDVICVGDDPELAMGVGLKAPGTFRGWGSLSGGPEIEPMSADGLT